MKSSIVFFIFVFLLLQIAGCKKETLAPVPGTRQVVEPVAGINEPVASVTDTVEVTTSPGLIIVKNLTWIFPWYNTIEVRDFGTMIPSNTLFKVFVQRGNSVDWKEVPLISNNSSNTIKYEYFVETRPDGAGMYNLGNLYIFYYGMDVKDNPSVKIEY